MEFEACGLTCRTTTVQFARLSRMKPERFSKGWRQSFHGVERAGKEQDGGKTKRIPPKPRLPTPPAGLDCVARARYRSSQDKESHRVLVDRRNRCGPCAALPRLAI